MLKCEKDDWHRIQDWPSWQSDDPMKGSTTMVGLSRIHPPLSCPHFRLCDGDCGAETMTTVICTGIIQHCDNRQHEKKRPLTVQMSLALTAIVPADMMKSGFMHRLLNSLKWSAASGVGSQFCSEARKLLQRENRSVGLAGKMQQFKGCWQVGFNRANWTRSKDVRHYTGSK